MRRNRTPLNIHRMNQVNLTSSRLVTFVATTILAIAAPISLAATATADTYEPGHWCPGNPKHMPFVPNGSIDWDWNVCHTWYPTNYGMGNVTEQGRPTSLWDGDNPPPAAIERFHCPPIAFMCP